MTEPYWSGSGITLYHGDCREVLEWLDAKVLITDPPYGRGWRQGRLGAGNRPSSTSAAHGGIVNDGSTLVRDEVLAMWGRRPAIVFGDLMLPPPGGTKQVLVYRKPPDAGVRDATAGFRRDLEAVYLLGPWENGIGGRTSMLATLAPCQGSPHSLAGRTGHPHAKPSDVMATLIDVSTGSIADPFAGSGSTLIAARFLGRVAIGVEIEERYCEVIAKRLDQGDLFGHGL